MRGRVGLSSGGRGGLGGEGTILDAVGFGFGSGIDYKLSIDDHAAVLGSFGRHALRYEVWTEDGNQGWCDVGAECCADCERAGVGHPVAWVQSQLSHLNIR